MEVQFLPAPPASMFIEDYGHWLKTIKRDPEKAVKLKVAAINPITDIAKLTTNQFFSKEEAYTLNLISNGTQVLGVSKQVKEAADYIESNHIKYVYVRSFAFKNSYSSNTYKLELSDRPLFQDLLSTMISKEPELFLFVFEKLLCSDLQAFWNTTITAAGLSSELAMSLLNIIAEVYVGKT